MEIDIESLDCVDYAFQFLGNPYRWGGNAIYMDCSGLVLECLKACRNFPAVDFTADDLFNFLKPRKNCQYVVNDFQRNDILFFGNLDHKIHTAIAGGRHKMIESGGGGSRTNTIEDAIKQGAMIRVRDIYHRRDLVGGIRIISNDWSFS